jgi:hypothetical protein
MPKCLADFRASPEGADVEVIGFLSSAGLVTDSEVAKRVAGVDFIVAGAADADTFPGRVGDCLELAPDGSCACAPPPSPTTARLPRGAPARSCACPPPR